MTAVEWIIEEINQQQKRYIDLAKKDKSFKKEVDAILTATTLLKMKCDQAKEMEKDQIMQSYFDGCFHEIKGFGNKPDDYYNDQFISVKP